MNLLETKPNVQNAYSFLSPADQKSSDCTYGNANSHILIPESLLHNYELISIPISIRQDIIHCDIAGQLPSIKGLSHKKPANGPKLYSLNTLLKFLIKEINLLMCNVCFWSHISNIITYQIWSLCFLPILANHPWSSFCLFINI